MRITTSPRTNRYGIDLLTVCVGMQKERVSQEVVSACA